MQVLFPVLSPLISWRSTICSKYWIHTFGILLMALASSHIDLKLLLKCVISLDTFTSSSDIWFINSSSHNFRIVFTESFKLWNYILIVLYNAFKASICALRLRAYARPVIICGIMFLSYTVSHNCSKLLHFIFCPIHTKNDIWQWKLPKCTMMEHKGLFSLTAATISDNFKNCQML